MDVETERILVARYQYPTGILPAAESVVVTERDPSKVPYQNGAISFDFALLYHFTCDGKTFQVPVIDEETYYWGTELSLEEVKEMPYYYKADKYTDSERFVITSWGAVAPLGNHEIVIPHPTAFNIPAELQIDPQEGGA